MILKWLLAASYLVLSVSASRVWVASLNVSSRTLLEHSVRTDADGKPKVKAKTNVKGRARGPTNVGSAEGNKLIDEGADIQHIHECDDPFPAGEKSLIECPSECALMRFVPDMMCHWKCINEEQCQSYVGVVNRDKGYCWVCAVPGCKRCMSDRQACEQCDDGFLLKKGKCVAEGMWKWYVLIAIAAVILTLVIAYVVYLAWRPVVSEEMLAWGMEVRSRVKNRRDDGDHALYSLEMSLADELTSAGGVGALLHFSWQRITLWWSIAVMVSCLAVTAYYGRLQGQDVLQLSPVHDEAEGVCNARLDPLAEREFEQMRVGFVWLTGAIYVVSTLGALVWAWWQRQKFRDIDAVTLNTKDFALVCHGFPVEVEGAPGSGGSKLEEEYKEFFQSVWGPDVIGVSIAWNIKDQEQVLATLNLDLIHRREKQLRLTGLDDPASDGVQSLGVESRGARSCKLVDTPECSDEESTREARRQSRTQCLCEPFTQLLASLNGLWFGELPSRLASLAGAEKDTGVDTETPGKIANIAQETLSSMQTTGSCYVVFRTEQSKLDSLLKPVARFRGAYHITVKDAQGDAETVLWNGFAYSDEERNWNMLKGVGMILCVIAVWTVAFWGPYTLYIMSWRKVEGASQGDVYVGTMVGFLITGGNQIVYAVCDVIAASVKFCCRDYRDMYYTGLYSFAVFVNTALDMWLVVIMAKGWRSDAAADPQALVRNPSMQHAVFIQLVFYLWPATLLAPFVLEPIVLNVAPYFLAKWLVRARPGCTKQEAEECLQPPHFDLNRYGDNLINIMMVVLFFFLTNVTLWWQFCTLVVSLLFIYGWDCYRFKRGTIRTHFASVAVDIMAQYVTAIPCALLAGAFVFKMMGGQGMVSSWDRDEWFKDHPDVWWKVSLSIIVHLVVHCLLLTFVVPRFVKEPANELDVAYQEMAASVCCNYFNANPVHVLRSQYIYCHKPAHVFYQPGREYLHQKNERVTDRDALIIYEAREYAKESGFFAEMASSAQYVFHDAAHMMRLSRGPTPRGDPSPQGADVTTPSTEDKK